MSVSAVTAPRRRRRLASGAATVAALLGLAVLAPAAAQAHVRVSPDQATPGSYAVLTFRVPTESATASTVKVELDLPVDHPFSSVSYEPVPGWTTQIVTSKLDTPVPTGNGATITEAPTKVTWTAEKGRGVAPGEFQRFTISAGAVPETGSIVLPVHQTYSDGEVVDWSEPTPASGEEPEHPAPTLYITQAPPSAQDDHAAVDDQTAQATPEVTAATGDSTSSGTSATADAALVVAIVGLVLGAAGLFVGLRGRRTRDDAAARTDGRPGTER